jgi:hypothetical protein
VAGRKAKYTVDYFPHYCNHKKTMYIIERQFGNDGYALWFKTLELLGKSDQHYYDCNTVDNWEYYLSYCGVNSISATEILNKLSELGSIDNNLWDKKIIWSAKFIEGIADVYRKRKTEIPLPPISDNINSISDNINSNNGIENTQSKVKYSKVNKSKVNQYSEQSSEVVLSKLLFELMLKNNPKAKEPNFQTWAVDIDRMKRIDKKSDQEIEGAIRWSQQDSFWCANILSTKKLREQYDKLYLAAKRSKNNGASKPAITESELREFAESIANDPDLE